MLLAEVFGLVYWRIRHARDFECLRRENAQGVDRDNCEGVRAVGIHGEMRMHCDW